MYILKFSKKCVSPQLKMANQIYTENFPPYLILYTKYTGIIEGKIILITIHTVMFLNKEGKPVQIRTGYASPKWKKQDVAHWRGPKCHSPPKAEILGEWQGRNTSKPTLGPGPDTLYLVKVGMGGRGRYHPSPQSALQAIQGQRRAIQGPTPATKLEPS